MARVHRLGQTKTVHVYRLCAGGTAEERVLQRSQKKLYLSEVVNRDMGGAVEQQENPADANEVMAMIKFGASAVFSSAGNREPSDAELDAVLDRGSTGDEMYVSDVGSVY